MSDEEVEEVEEESDEAAESPAEPDPPAFGPAEAAEVAGRLVEALGSDLSSLLNVEAELSTGGTDQGAPQELGWPGPLVVQPLRIGELGGLLACPTADAAMLGALQAGGDAAAAKAAHEAGALGEHADAYAEVRKLVTTLLGPCFEGHATGELAGGDTSLIADPAQGGFPQDGPHVRVEISLALEGCGTSTLYLLFGGGAAGSQGQRALVIIDPRGEERDRMEELGEETEREITAIDPSDLDDDAYDAIAEAGAVLVCWDLGGRSGLEVAEQLVRDPRSKDVPVLLAHPRVTRAMVECALRAGAGGFVLLPYDLAEIDRQIAG